jgi:hypothetical protein
MESEALFGLKPVGQGTLWSAPVNPPEGRRVASIRLDQSPLRRDQISVKLSSPSLCVPKTLSEFIER